MSKAGAAHHTTPGVILKAPRAGARAPEEAIQFLPGVKQTLSFTKLLHSGNQ